MTKLYKDILERTISTAAQVFIAAYVADVDELKAAAVAAGISVVIGCFQHFCLTNNTTLHEKGL